MPAQTDVTPDSLVPPPAPPSQPVPPTAAAPQPLGPQPLRPQPPGPPPLGRPPPGAPPPALAPAPAADLIAARRELRRQLAGLERTWAGLLAEAPSGTAAGPACGAVASRQPRLGAGRLLGLAELEVSRDQLLAAIDRARASARAEQDRQAAARRQLEAMIADPARHRFACVNNQELGVSGCGVYQVRPRLGLIGMLAGWWEVKLSSGCP